MFVTRKVKNNEEKAGERIKDKTTWWMMNRKVWIVPVTLGVITTAWDFINAQGELHKDGACWIITILCMLIAAGILKKVIPVNTGNPIIGVWMTFVLATAVWPFVCWPRS